jgi:hypothetical protein
MRSTILAVPALVILSFTGFTQGQGPPGGSTGNKRCCDRQNDWPCVVGTWNCTQLEPGYYRTLVFQDEFDDCKAESPQYEGQNCEGSYSVCARYNVYSDSSCLNFLGTDEILRVECTPGSDTCE